MPIPPTPSSQPDMLSERPFMWIRSILSHGAHRTSTLGFLFRPAWQWSLPITYYYIPEDKPVSSFNSKIFTCDHFPLWGNRCVFGEDQNNKLAEMVALSEVLESQSIVSFLWNSNSVVVTSTDLDSRFSGFDPRFCLSAAHCSANYSASLCLSYVICKMKITMIPFSRVILRMKQVNLQKVFRIVPNP